MMSAQVIMLIVGILGIRFFAKIISIDRKILLPVIFLLSIVGAYSMRNSMFDVWLALLFGIIGYFMQRYEIPLSPILLALILGPMAESNLRLGLVLTRGSFLPFLTRPITLILLLLAVASVISSYVKQRKLNQKIDSENASA